MHYTRVCDAQHAGVHCQQTTQMAWVAPLLLYLFIFVSLSLPLSLCVCDFTVYECHPCYGLTLVVCAWC